MINLLSAVVRRLRLSGAREFAVGASGLFAGGKSKLSLLRMFSIGIAVCATGGAAAGDVAAGEAKAETCVACHGVAGNEPIADYPKLAGQSRKYLLQVMREYQSGKRVNPVMNAQISKGSGYSDKDLQDLAAYFAAQDGDLGY